MSGDLTIDEAVTRGYPPAVLYLRNDEIVTTEVCAFNYFSIFLKEHPEAAAHVWLFDGAGNQTGYFHKDLGLNGQLQLNTSDLSSNVSGTVAMTLMPKHEAKVRSGKKVTTGYYAQYYSRHGAITLSHEREPVAAESFPTSAWVQTYLARFLEWSGVVLVNPCLALDGAAVGTAALVALDGTVLAERTLPRISPMGACRISTLDLFPDARRLVGHADSFAMEFKGTNIASPFSYYEFANGKFSLHHF
ncbi:hypothetical protein [Bradyrhizobium sp. dw_78]|uniref:hypothetical protein n=1 Tax=Bradyrhizobium sp. dw_78 TaxID=2719793 RepID=UPI001BD20A04|nr:hypothetical protein [Bradyrhizobium sp. dw_78]